MPSPHQIGKQTVKFPIPGVPLGVPPPPVAQTSGPLYRRLVVARAIQPPTPALRQPSPHSSVPLFQSKSKIKNRKCPMPFGCCAPGTLQSRDARVLHAHPGTICRPAHRTHPTNPITHQCRPCSQSKFKIQKSKLHARSICHRNQSKKLSCYQPGNASGKSKRSQKNPSSARTQSNLIEPQKFYFSHAFPPSNL